MQTRESIAANFTKMASGEHPYPGWLEGFLVSAVEARSTAEIEAATQKAIQAHELRNQIAHSVTSIDRKEEAADGYHLQAADSRVANDIGC